MRESIGANSAGGALGYITYGESARYKWGFSLVGPIGATIAYAGLSLVSLLFLTSFNLGDWLRNRVSGAEEKSKAETPEEVVLERKARDLQKQAKKLQEEVDKNGDRAPAERSGLGADMQPVPEPTVRDLSISPSKPRTKKPAPEPVKEPAPAEDAIIIPARELAAATTADVLGKSAETKADEKPTAVAKSEEEAKTDSEKPAEPKPEPVVHIADNSVPAPRPKPVAFSQAETDHRGFDSEDWKLPIAVDGVSCSTRTCR